MASHITKILHDCRKALVPVISAAVIMALALGGQGDSAALTAFGQTLSAGKEETIKNPARAGQLVVGYLLTQEILRREEVQEAAIRRMEDLKEQITWDRENKIQDAPGISGISLSGEDYQTLLRIVEAEAGVCDSKGKILVANVVLNRVRSGEFPNTVREVVYQPSQFSPVSNGSINTCKVTSQTVECVKRALAGEDYSQGALYFMNRRAAGSGAASWFDGRLTFLFRHGGHEFFK